MQMLLGICQIMESEILQYTIHGIILGWLIYDNWKFARLHDAHQSMILSLSILVVSIHIRIAMLDLQMGNIPYSTVKKLIDESGLNEADVKNYNEMLEELVFAYNIKKDEE